MKQDIRFLAAYMGALVLASIIGGLWAYTQIKLGQIDLGLLP